MISLSLDGQVTTPALYEAYGLTISSDLPLPLPRARVAAGAQPGRRPDVVVRRGSADDLSDAPLDREAPGIVASYELPGGRWYVAFADGDGYRLRFRDCGEFVLSDGLRTVRWIPAGSRAELLPVLFAGTVLAFVLTMQGRLVLHASAVVRGPRALAFAGQSGRGKSTLAALAAAAGARIVTDDVLLVDVGGTVRCRGTAGELRLRDSARTLAAAFAGPVERRETADRRLGLLTGHAEPGWVGLGAVAVPRPSRQAAAVEVRRVPPSDAVLWLLAFPRVHGLRPAAVLRRQFELLGALVRGVPVYDVVVPWGPPFPDGVADRLLELAAGGHAPA